LIARLILRQTGDTDSTAARQHLDVPTREKPSRATLRAERSRHGLAQLGEHRVDLPFHRRQSVLGGGGSLRILPPRGGQQRDDGLCKDERLI
jgi:hypothetical protein